MTGSPIKDEYFIRERKHRLGNESYIGYATTAYTLCIANRIPLFTDQNRVVQFEQFLKQALTKYSSTALVYLFMPDHVHLLVQGMSPESNTKKSVIHFKQASGFWLSKNIPAVKWQKNFYDHVLRKDDDINKQIRYILLNPVRKELVSSWQQYPFKGSTVFNLSDWEQTSW